MQRTGFRWLSRRRYTIVAALAVSVLLISSIVLIPRGISLYAQSGNSGPNNNYVPSSAFGDTDDLPSGSIHAQRVGLAAGSATVSGGVKDASTGNPVANALVGISAGAVGSTAQ